jgi:hypothetical protein
MKLVTWIKMCLNEIHSKVPIQNGRKEGDALSPLLFNLL